jgi:hypothetical protein
VDQQFAAWKCCVVRAANAFPLRASFVPETAHVVSEQLQFCVPAFKIPTFNFTSAVENPTLQ